MSTPAQVAKKFDRLATNIQGMPRILAEGGALMVKKTVQKELRAVVPSGRLRNVGKRGARVGVRYDLYPNSAKVFMFGPAQLVESDTKPHRIPRTTRGRRGRPNKKPIVIPGVGIRQHAMHPGTRGRHPWRKGVNQAIPRIPVASQQHLDDVLQRSFRGTASTARRLV